MEDKKILLDNIDKIHTTEMGIDRIKRNLKIDTADVVEYCKNKVLDKNCNIYKQGKNWYCEVENIKITINSYSYGAAAEFYNTMRPYFVPTHICVCIIALFLFVSIYAIIKIYNRREI